MSSFVINPYAFAGEDADAKAYLDAVETADGQALESGVRKAVDDFVKGCKTDGVWSALKAACILMGARTIAGSLVNLPTATTIATNNNFVSEDYNRKTGLKGNGSTKTIKTGRAGNDDPQNDFHLTVYVNAVGTTGSGGYICNGGGGTGQSNIFDLNPTLRFRSRNGTASDITNGNVAGFIGNSRNASGSFTARQNKTNTTFNTSSNGTYSQPIVVFGLTTDNGSTYGFLSNARIQFYSAGTSLDLVLLDSRLQTLSSDISASIA